MSSFTDIAGPYDTAREIAQQPEVWGKVMDLLERRRGEIARYLRAAGALGSGGVAGRREATIILSGAGSSEFVGCAAAAALRARLLREVEPIPTTHLVTHPTSRLSPRRRYVVVHFARSGDSPESLAAYRMLRGARPDARHVVITCNAEGALGRQAAADSSTLLITLPPETNDRSLAMTSSFSSMALAAAALGWIESFDELRREMQGVQAAARRLLSELSSTIAAFGARGFTRVCYLGSDSLAGAMREGALKMLEMTAGGVTSVSDSFLGIRHGPQVFINGHCAVVACVSSDPKVRRYEIDLLRELRSKGQGNGVLAITDAADESLRGVSDTILELSPGRPPVAADLRMLTDIVVCQILAFHKSRSHGLSPDNPSPAGLINRVVQGVAIYDT